MFKNLIGFFYESIVSRIKSVDMTVTIVQKISRTFSFHLGIITQVVFVDSHQKMRCSSKHFVKYLRNGFKNR